jgi:hypothetical protein
MKEANNPNLSLISFVALKQVTIKKRKIPIFNSPHNKYNIVAVVKSLTDLSSSFTAVYDSKFQLNVLSGRYKKPIKKVIYKQY